MAKESAVQQLLIRALSATVFVAVVLASFYAGPWPAVLLFGLFTAIGCDESYRLIRATGNATPMAIPGIVSGVLLFGMTTLLSMEMLSGASMVWLVLPVVILFMLQLFFSPKNAFVNSSTTISGALYVAGGFSFVPVLMYFNGTYSYELPLGIIFLVWANDTFAYFTGRFLGKHKMFPAISPRKTWEGFVGGFVFAILTGWVIGQFWDDLQVHEWMICGAITAVFSTIGDFLESLFKRQAGVKDSGKLMPGHGGVLDRFDGFLFALPVVFLYVSRITA